MNKYETLVEILDRLRNEAPREYKSYYPLDSDIEKISQARSKAFIHLFLKVKFGILDFKFREHFITDGKNDGGIDAYYIDTERKKVYFIQSKFRLNTQNFENKEIQFKELLSMEADRIIEEEETDITGIEYNGKIKQLIREVQEIPDIARYDYQIIILANLKDQNQFRLRKLTGNVGEVVVFDNKKTYEELVFPIITGTYYNQEELKIQLNLINKTSQSSRISYNVETEHSECEISVVFVPTIEIAKALLKYKNSILKYNPRSYLDLANNSVNEEIAKTITSTNTNEFALFNNGITMLSYETVFKDKVGQKNKGQLIVNQPQIINGGQTAFTLSRILEDNLNDKNVESLFADKEVLLKVITFPEDTIKESPEHLKLIEAISKATNQQTPVSEADRRSNDKIQIEIQKAIFDTYGYFYERKRGEYSDGVRSGYVRRSQIIDRELFIRLCKSCDLKPSEARRSSVRFLFQEGNFEKTLNDVNRYKEYFFAYLCYQELLRLEKRYSKDLNNQFGIATFGNAIRYGKFAVVTACRILYKDDFPPEKIVSLVTAVLSSWLDFENHISKLFKNKSYFTSYIEDGVLVREMNYDNYYKGKTLNNDLQTYFKPSKFKILE